MTQVVRVDGNWLDGDWLIFGRENLSEQRRSATTLGKPP